MCVDLDGEHKAIQFAVDELLADCTSDEDRDVILQQFAGLKAKLAGITNVVERKTAAYNILVEHLQLLAAARDTVACVRDRMEDGELAAEELSDHQSDLNAVRNQLMGLESRYVDVEALLTEAGITVRDTDKVTDGVKKLLSDVESKEKKLKLCVFVVDLNSQLSAISNSLQEMGAVYLDNVDDLLTTVKVSFVCFYFACFFLVFQKIMFFV